jgi:hypothetical protein
MSRTLGSKNIKRGHGDGRLPDGGRSEKLAPKDCPERTGGKGTRLYAWWCKSLCKKYEECSVWLGKESGASPILARPVLGFHQSEAESEEEKPNSNSNPLFQQSGNRKGGRKEDI